MVFDVEGGREEARGSGSTENYEEVSFVVALLNAYFAAAAGGAGSVAVITPYKAQVSSLAMHHCYKHLSLLLLR